MIHDERLLGMSQRTARDITISPQLNDNQDNCIIVDVLGILQAIQNSESPIDDSLGPLSILSPHPRNPQFMRTIATTLSAGLLLKCEPANSTMSVPSDNTLYFCVGHLNASGTFGRDHSNIEAGQGRKRTIDETDSSSCSGSASADEKVVIQVQPHRKKAKTSLRDTVVDGLKDVLRGRSGYEEFKGGRGKLLQNRDVCTRWKFVLDAIDALGGERVTNLQPLRAEVYAALEINETSARDAEKGARLCEKFTQPGKYFSAGVVEQLALRVDGMPKGSAALLNYLKECDKNV